MLARTGPRLIVEIGSWMGGGLYAWRSTGAEVIGVTLDQARNTVNPHGARMIWGDSTDPLVRRKLVVALAGRRPDFVFIDGDHSAAGVQADWQLARQVGARLAGFHDIAHRVHGPDIRPTYQEAYTGRHHHELIDPGDLEPDGTGLVWL